MIKDTDMNKNEILEGIQNIRKEYGEWAYDIPLPHDVWTRGNLNIPHTRLRRIVQIVSDLVGKPLSECRILDLGCLDGMFSLEFALQGAETVGVEIREDNIKKALFSKDVLNLHNLEFRQDDARNISIESYGMFDAIICSGLLYHLTAPDAIELIAKMYNMSRKVVIVDTHIALEPKSSCLVDSEEYWGELFHEHDAGDTDAKKAKRLWASWDNNESFWFTRPSLINIFNKAGYTSVYECFNPVHLNYGKSGIEHLNRCSFVGIKGEQRKIVTSPAVNNLNESWPKNSLDYSVPKNIKYFIKKVLFKLKGN